VSPYSGSLPAGLPGEGERVLAGAVAIVTGAASGIGRRTALMLASHGAAMALVDISAEGLATVANEIAQRGGKAEAFPCDLADRVKASALVDTVVERLGRVDILINSAGVGSATSLLDATAEQWDEQYAVNLLAPFLLMQAAGRQMIAQGQGGRIVNLSSSSAFRAHAGCAYAAMKSAVAVLARTAAADLGAHGITVNAIAPGLTRTPMVTGAGLMDQVDQLVLQGPLANLTKRVSEAEDIAATILFLCMPAARQITAQIIHVSAGAVV
jgi:NAD(P)-dependent dehydrogenase (short-subunit alcohol dehydrogenase family)